jgi:hypothetical protein
VQESAPEQRRSADDAWILIYWTAAAPGVHRASRGPDAAGARPPRANGASPRAAQRARLVFPAALKRSEYSTCSGVKEPSLVGSALQHAVVYTTCAAGTASGATGAAAGRAPGGAARGQACGAARRPPSRRQ